MNDEQEPCYSLTAHKQHNAMDGELMLHQQIDTCDETEPNTLASRAIQQTKKRRRQQQQQEKNMKNKSNETELPRTSVRVVS